MSGKNTSDVLVIGGGVVGAALAAGMVGRGASIRLLDGGDADLRAARANFGLVWVQSKGHSMPAYARWSRRSADLWHGFAEELGEATGVSLQFRQNGGLSFCLSEDDLQEKRDAIARLHNQREPWSADVEVIERPALEKLLPGLRLGPKVTGASYSPQDGEADPLALLRALHEVMRRNGVDVRSGVTAQTIARTVDVFRVTTTAGVFEAPRIILAAGHGSVSLAGQVGLAAPLRPERGQILVTERLAPFLPFAGDTLRQTADGTVMIGATNEDAGFSLATTPEAGAMLARHATDVFPQLADARLVRTWAGLRVLTPDGCPLYAESKTHPGAALITCHSGVTLAAVHARELAPALLAGKLGSDLSAFGPERFGGQNVPEAA